MEYVQENLLKLDLQFFSEDNTDSEESISTKVNTNIEGNEDKDTKVENDDSTEKPLTLEDVKKMIQSENDKIRTEYSKKLKAKDIELEEVKKSNMTEQERLDYENKSLQEQLMEREKALLEKEEAFNRSQLELDAVDILKQHDLPIEAKSFLVSTNVEVTTNNILAFKVMFDEAIEKEIKERIKGTTKEHKETSTSGLVTKEQFAKMGFAQKNELYMTNPELYKELRK